MISKSILATLLTLMLAFAGNAHAQPYAWCGFILLSGMPIAENHLEMFSALTPDDGLPDQQFQFRYNLAHTEVLIEGCWQVLPTREIAVILLDQVMTQTFEEIDSQLVWSAFALDGSHIESAYYAREYIASHIAEWE